MVPFECNTYVFRKLRKSDPNLDKVEDRLLMGGIRRVSLDTIWVGLPPQYMVKHVV